MSASNLRTSTSESWRTCTCHQLDEIMLDRGNSTETDAAAARKNAGERREGTVMHQRVNRWVVQLQGDDVVLARESWWRESARSELPTVEAESGGGGARREQGFSGNWGRSVGRRARARHGEAGAGVGWGGGGPVWAAHGRAVHGRSGGRRRRRNAARALEIGLWK
jgi:hypothetical protein